jgi:hypothetical protein
MGTDHVNHLYAGRLHGQTCHGIGKSIRRYSPESPSNSLWCGRNPQDSQLPEIVVRITQGWDPEMERVMGSWDIVARFCFWGISDDCISVEAMSMETARVKGCHDHNR